MIARLQTIIFTLLLTAGAASAQIPEAHRLPDVHMIDFDRSGDSLVRDYGGRPGAPTLHGSALQSGGHPLAGRLEIPAGTDGWCQTNRPLNLAGEWTIGFYLRDEVYGHDGSLEYLLGSYVPSGFRIFRGGAALSGELRIRGLTQEVIVTGYYPYNDSWVWLVQDAQELRVYIDGYLRVTSQQQNTLSIPDPRGLLIGANDGRNSFKGFIDEVYVWNEARTESELRRDLYYGWAIVQYYNPQFPAVTPNGFYFGNDVSNTQFTTEFDDLRRTWSQDENDAPPQSADGDWYLRWGPTPTPGAGPDADRTFGVGREGYYIHVDDDGEHAEVRIWSPVWDMLEVVEPYLSFWIHSNNASGGGADAVLSFEIRELTPAGPVESVLPYTIGHVGDEWTRVEYDITAFAGSIIQLGLVANTDNGHALHDIALDEIQIASGTAIAQPSDRDRAVLSLYPFGGYNAAYYNAYTGAPGPYHASIDGADGLDIRVKGNPGQPVILAAGPLNADGPWPFGVINLGGALDPLTGLIDDVVIVGDGTSASFPGFLFRTDADGYLRWGFGTLPPLPPGPLIAFQAIVFTGDSDVIAVSNALEIVLE